MKPVSLLSDSALEFNAQDAFEAIQANPDNPKVPQFFAERQACLIELEERKLTRNERKYLREIGIDPLTRPLKQRKYYKGRSNPYWTECLRNAQIQTGLKKVLKSSGLRFKHGTN